MSLANLSYRYKVPLALSVAILCSGLLVTAVLIARAHDDFEKDLVGGASDIGHVLAAQLIPAMRHDDLWLAYQTLDALKESELNASRLLLVLDEQGRVYVANRPQEFPAQSEPGASDPEVGEIRRRIGSNPELQVFEPLDGRRLYIVLPLINDGIPVGHLIIGYERSLIWPRLIDIYWRVTWSSLLALAVLLPFGWYLGRRMVAPLTQLAACMREVGRRPADEIRCGVSSGDDEIGQLGEQFNMMLDELSEKERIEQQMLATERLAAVGRVAAGVAHEINNPLGGLLNALNTFRRFHASDEISDRTVSLLERGLGQIRDTVAAMLVQARPESHPLAKEDVDDVRRLLLPEAEKRQVGLRLHNHLRESTPLPSTPVRQILINLALNAVQAADPGSIVECTIAAGGGVLLLKVENAGRPIPSERMGELFEPFRHARPDGQGLGLWVTYQLVQHLHGEITVLSEAGINSFAVTLPLLEEVAA